MRYIDACGESSWSLLIWGKGTGEDPRILPYSCRSWRHDGPCRAWCGACDFRRIAEGLKKYRCWTYCVLTYPARSYPDVSVLFRIGLQHWRHLHRLIQKRFGKVKYIQTWEVHKSMYPHVNITIASPDVYDEACNAENYENPKWLQPLALKAGFGKQCWGEPIRSPEAMAGYLTKLGLELTGQAVKGQVPVNAPRHFRRIRASRGLLPKRAKDDTITGQLFRVSMEQLQREHGSVNEPPDMLADPTPDPTGTKEIGYESFGDAAE